MASFEFHPLTPDRWQDLETLFGPRGACSGCWCMYWRLSASQFASQSGEPNRQLFKALVDSGEVPGLLAYADGKPVGLISLGPRSAYSRLDRSRILSPVDDQPVWSVVCFFVQRAFRRQGLMVKLLEAGVKYAHSQGANIIEGYPIEPKNEKVAPVFIYTGIASAFHQAGFVEVARRSETRPIMRWKAPTDKHG